MSVSRFTFRQPRMRCVVRDGDNKATRLMLLAPTVKGDGDPPPHLYLLICPRSAPADPGLGIGSYDT